MLYGVSCLLDAIDGHAARLLGQTSRFGAVLDMITDRYVSYLRCGDLSNTHLVDVLPLDYSVSLHPRTLHMHWDSKHSLP